MGKYINKIFNGDIKDLLKKLPDNSIDLIVTSPPYKNKDNYEDACTQDNFRSIYRILKPNSLFFLNFGHLKEDKFRPFEVCHRAMYFAKFKLNDTITWVKNHYTPLNGKKNLNNLTEFIFVLYKNEMPDLDRLSIGIPYKDKCLSIYTRVIVKFDNEIRVTTLNNLYKTWKKKIYTKIQIPSWNFNAKVAEWVNVINITEPKKRNIKILKLRNNSEVHSTLEHRFPILKCNKGKQVLSNMEVSKIQERVIKQPSRPVSLFVAKNLSSLMPTDDNQPLYNYDTGYILGLYLAEGFMFGKYAFRFAGHEKEKNDKQFGLFIKTYFNKYFNVKTKVYTCKKSKGIQFQIDCGVFSNIIKEHIMGNNALNKELNLEKCILRGTNFIKGIIDGFIIGDGHSSLEYNYHSFGTGKNLGLINSLRTICLLIGYEFKQNKDSLSTAPDGKKHLRQNFWIRQNLNTRQKQKDNGLFCERIESINEPYGKAQKGVLSLDIEVDNEHHMFFLANGMLTHNSNIGRYSDKDLKCGGNVWHIDIPTITKKSQRLHCDEYPLELPTRCIKLSGLKSGVLLDPFSGSFTSQIAAKKLGLDWVGADKNFIHCQTAQDRFFKEFNQEIEIVKI